MSTLMTHKKHTDSEVHRLVIEELKWDSVVDETDVGVEVDDGVVTLTGTVGSYAEKTAAREAAHRVMGVLDVANDIEVHVPGSKAKSDTEIAQAVRAALEWDTLVPHERIQSTVSAGWITLAGAVANWQQRGDAENAVRNLAGVKGVVNKIVVAPLEAAPTLVREAIEQALERQAERDADRIRVDLYDGHLTLSGIVHSWHEKRAVLGAAGHAPGVTDVADRLLISPNF